MNRALPPRDRGNRSSKASPSILSGIRTGCSLAENRGVTSFRKVDRQQICRAFRRVVFSQFRTQSRRVYPHHGTQPRIEIPVGSVKFAVNDDLLECNLGDVLALQNEIASAIAAEVQGKLREQTTRRLRGEARSRQ